MVELPAATRRNPSVLHWVVLFLLAFMPARQLSQWHVAETAHFRINGGIGPAPWPNAQPF
jgi:hypothetical protein